MRRMSLYTGNLLELKRRPQVVSSLGIYGYSIAEIIGTTGQVLELKCEGVENVGDVTIQVNSIRLYEWEILIIAQTYIIRVLYGTGGLIGKLGKSPLTFEDTYNALLNRDYSVLYQGVEEKVAEEIIQIITKLLLKKAGIGYSISFS